MKRNHQMIQGIPAVFYGEEAEKGYLFVHGQGGNKEEAAAFAECAIPLGFQVAGIDLPGHGGRAGHLSEFVPWAVVPELRAVLSSLKERWGRVSLRANSIGAYFSMLAFAEEPLEQALLVSPIVDMERLIVHRMDGAGVTEDQLRTRGEISTGFGQSLSWKYLCWVREHPLTGWHCPTKILYAGQDSLTAPDTVRAFAAAHGADLTVYGQGEHWFHTPEQLAVLRDWEERHA